jgi:long-chain acyl-CoA synthetase
MTDKKTILDWAYHWEKATPDKVFATQPMGGGDASVRDWTWRQMMDEARRMAAHLKSLDLPDKSQISICSKNCIYWVMADLAIWMAGHVSVPVFPTLTPDTVRHILEHSESKLLFVGKLDPVWDEMKAGVPDGLPQIAFPLSPDREHDQWDDIIAKTAPLEDDVVRDAAQLSTIIYTSGSTGKPKGVMHDFTTTLACSAGISALLRFNANDRYISYLPIAHGMERWLGEHVMIRDCCHVFYVESLDTFVHDLQRCRPTLFMSVPRLWTKFQLGVFHKMPPQKLERLMKIPILSGVVKKKILKGLGLDQVRFAGSGSAPMPRELLQWYRDLGLELIEGYGMTENFNFSHLTRPGRSRVGYVGEPYDGVECRIANDGEIQVKGPGTMVGYFKMPEETREVITEDGWLRTGDRGELDELSRLRITGRTKEIFKTSKGKYVAPAPIEQKVLNHPRIESACVSGAGYPQPHVVVMLSEDARRASGAERQTILRELEEHLQKVNATLETYEQLQFISVVSEEWLPENGFLTPTMKIKRAKIEEVYGPKNESWYGSGSSVVWS